MKINKKNVIIPSLLTTISAALVGSIAGTVAWYQYNTRVSASYYGTSAGSATENLQLSLDGINWGAELKAADIQAYLNADGSGRTGNQISPVTAGEHAKDGQLGQLYKNPIYQHEKTESWGRASKAEDYISFPIHLRVLDVDGNQTDADKYAAIEKEIYFQDVVLKGSNTNNITDAIRLHVSGHHTETNISAHGNDTKTHGALDLLNDGVDQKDKSQGYEDLGDEVHVIDYGVDPAEIDGYVEHEADLLLEEDYFLVDLGNADAADDKYYQFNGSAWVASDDEPTSGRDRGVLHQVAELPAVVAEDDVYFAYEDDKLFVLKDDGSWEEKKVVAGSYNMSSDELIANDDDPDHLVDGKVLGKTVASVNKAADLPANAQAGDKAFVRNDTLDDSNQITAAKGMYEFDGSDWKIIDLEANDKYFVWNTTTSSWDEVAAQPGEGQDLGSVDEESLLPVTANEKDFIKVTYASEDADNQREDLTLNLTIYLEGWQLLDGKSVWDSGYIGTEYKVGMTFVCEAR